MSTRKILTASAGVRVPVTTLRPVLDECPWKDRMTDDQARDLERFERFLRTK